MNALKQSLVKSYIVSIALGILLAQGLLSLAAIVVEPLNRFAAKVSARNFQEGFVSDSKMEIFDLPFSLVQLGRGAIFIASSLALAYWLYRPVEPQPLLDQRKDEANEVPSQD